MTATLIRRPPKMASERYGPGGDECHRPLRQLRDAKLSVRLPRHDGAPEDSAAHGNRLEGSPVSSACPLDPNSGANRGFRAPFVPSET